MKGWSPSSPRSASSRAWNLSPGASCYRAELGRGPALIGSDEHVQTTGPEHDDRHSPRPAKGVAVEKQHAGLPEPDAKPSAASIRPPGERGAEGLCPSVASSLPDTYAAPGPGSATWKDPDPRRRSSRGSGGSEQACLPGDGGYATPAACPVSTTSWRYSPRRTCRLVNGRSHRPRSTWPTMPG